MPRTRYNQGDSGLTIEDLAGFNRALRTAARATPAAVKVANKELADKIIRSARATAGTQPGKAKASARTLRATRSVRSSTITGGGARAPWFYGAEFGSKHYHQFQPWRGNQFGGWSGGPGYFLHPAIRKVGPDALQEYWKELEKITRQAFPR